MAAAAGSSSNPLAPLSAAEQDSVLRARLAVPERSLRMLMKRFAAIASAKDEGERAANLHSFTIDLSQYLQNISRQERVSSLVSPSEIARYNAEAVEVADERKQLEADIEALKLSLEQARRDRENKLEYDVVAKKILALTSREDGEETLEKLRTQLSRLQAEAENYVSMAKRSRERVQNIMAELTSLSNDVGWEIGERERREVEREGEGDVGDGDGDAADAQAEEGEEGEDGQRTKAPDSGDAEEGEASTTSGGKGSRGRLNPAAAPFKPTSTGLPDLDGADTGASSEVDESAHSSRRASAATAAKRGTKRRNRRAGADEDGDGDEEMADGDNNPEEGAVDDGEEGEVKRAPKTPRRSKRRDEEDEEGEA